LKLRPDASIFADMKHAFILLVISLSVGILSAAAQDVPTAPPPTTAADIAAQQGAEERYKRMAADMQALQMDNESLKGKIASLEQKIDDLRQQLAASANNTGVQEDLKRLAEKIAEVDKKREEDRQSISDEIRKSIGGLEKTLAGSGASPRSTTPRLAPVAEPTASENGFSYTIREGDTLSAILKAYNTDFKSKGWKTITLKQAMEANPTIDWARLRVGQKIIIPRPEGQ
jgi:peptidoglycan hydrolase CwlO-like protein